MSAIELDPSDPKATVCGFCNRGWDDSVSTDVTPTPAGRCPFEYEHVYGIMEGPHTGHAISYNERAVACRIIAGVTDEGDIKLDGAPPEIECITETFLHCETCGVPVTGEEIGASDSWQVM